MSVREVVFWILAVVSVVSALGVVSHRNPIRAAMLLVANFVALALIYLTMNAQVLAMLQIIVYAGAIMVLFLFVIQLLNLGGESAPEEGFFASKFSPMLLGGFLLAAIGVGIFYNAANPVAQSREIERVVEAEKQGISQIQIVGWDLFTKYVYPFELTSFLLLVGAIGVMILTRRRAAGAAGASDARS